MKKAIALALVLLAISCKKEEKPVKINFDGRWLMLSDTTRYINVKQIDDSTVNIIYPRSITGPTIKPVTVVYKAFKRNDTICCVSGNRYPACYFINRAGIVEGYIEEWLIPLEIGKLKNIKR